jgi:hypothetical protein
MLEGIGLVGASVAVPIAAKALGLTWKSWVVLGLVAIGAAVTVPMMARKPDPAASSKTDSIPKKLLAQLPVPPALEGPIQPTLAPSGTADSLTDEIHLLDRARGALSVDAPRRALDVLEQYDQRHPRGRFEPEAVALRVEALHALGETQAARALGEQFLTLHPTNPLANRVAKIIRP